MARVFVRINRQIREAESVMVAPCDPETLLRASKVLAELKQQRGFVASRLRAK
jgi:hypothetical protein